MLGEKEWKYVAQQISLAHRTINFSVTEKKFIAWDLLFLRLKQHLFDSIQQ